jgi:hypothetical protein
MTGAAIGAGTAYSSGTSEFTSGLCVFFTAQSLFFCACKKSLKISEMYSKAVNGRIDNTMTYKKDKRTNNDLQRNAQKTKD